MGTRAAIAIENLDGTIESVYCHWDGYPEHVGKTLLNHYSSEEKLRALLAEGDMSSLGVEIGSKHDFDDQPPGQTTFYGRDRGEEGVEAKIHDDRDEYLSEQGQEYNYLFSLKESQWFVSEGDDFEVLEEVLKAVNNERLRR